MVILRAPIKFEIMLLSANILLAGGEFSCSEEMIPRAAIDAWNDYRNALATRGVVIEEKVKNSGTPAGSVWFRWSPDGASRKTNVRPVAQDGGYFAHVRNDRYAFGVVSEGGSSWNLDDLLIGSVDSRSGDIIMQDQNRIPLRKSVLGWVLRDASVPALAGMLIETVLLPDAIRDDLIKVESIREIQEGGDNLVEITIRRSLNVEPGFAVNYGKVTLAPRYQWMILDLSVDLVSKSGIRGTLVQKNSYSTDVSDIFPLASDATPSAQIPVVITHSKLDKRWDSGEELHQESEYVWSPEIPHESEFRLTHYGLPEPAFSNDGWGRRGTIMVLCTLAILISIAGLMARWKGRGDGTHWLR